jgi:peptidoglycan hydrolase-like protein with peptidoglycan-binding domain
MASDGSLQFQEPLVVNQQSLARTVQIPLQLGQIDPVDEVSGQLKRLKNLGYYPSVNGDDPDAKLFRAAVEEFQCENHLTVDGICGPQTQAKLKAVYGC